MSTHIGRHPRPLLVLCKTSECHPPMQHCAAFGVPSESADASLLLAWLSRNVAMPAGCLLNVPPDLPQSLNDHIAHLLQCLMKVLQLGVMNI